MRLFSGVEVPVGVRKLIALLARSMQKSASGRYATYDMYHITLAYIGESDDDMRLRAMEAIKTCACDFSAPILSPGKPGYFGKRENSILHLSVNGGEALKPICSELRYLLACANLPFDPKPFNPHIILARHVNAAALQLEMPVDIPGFSAEGITLFNSCRVDGVLRYIPMYFEPFHKPR